MVTCVLPVPSLALEHPTALKINTVSLVLQLIALLVITRQRLVSDQQMSALPVLQVKFALTSRLEFTIVSKDLSAPV